MKILLYLKIIFQNYTGDGILLGTEDSKHNISINNNNFRNGINFN